MKIESRTLPGIVGELVASGWSEDDAWELVAHIRYPVPVSNDDIDNFGWCSADSPEDFAQDERNDPRFYLDVDDEGIYWLMRKKL